MAFQEFVERRWLCRFRSARGKSQYQVSEFVDVRDRKAIEAMVHDIGGRAVRKLDFYSQALRPGIWRIIWNVRKSSEIRKAYRCRERSSRKNGGFAQRAGFRRRHKVAFKDNTLRMHGPDVMIAEHLVKSVDELLRGGVL